MEASLLPIESETLKQHIFYNYKLTKLDPHRLSVVSKQPSPTHQHIKKGWLKEFNKWLDFWDIQNNITPLDSDKLKVQIANIVNQMFWNDDDI